MSNDTVYIYIGTAENSLDTAMPDPTGAPFATATKALWEVNANGVEVGQQVGEPHISQEISWGVISAADWWALGRFFAANGDVFWCKFFNHEVGEWQVKRYRRMGRGAESVLYGQASGEPEYYLGARVEIKSIGE